MKKNYSASFYALVISIFAYAFTNAQVSNPTLANPNLQNQTASTSGTMPLWSVGPECMPENLKAFEENKGQFEEIEKQKILFGCNYQGMNVRLDKNGVIYNFSTSVKMTEKEIEERGEKAGANEEQEKKEPHFKLLMHNVSVEFEGANPNPTIEGSEKTPYYFGGIDATDPHHDMGEIKGYGKVTYHDMYPGIDVVFSFQEKHGIKYSINVKPGYDASVVKMRYTGQDNLSIDDKGNICMGIAGKSVIDHAPVTTQNGNTVSSSFYMISKNEIGFKLGETDKNSEILIDPAVTWTTPIPGTYPIDCGLDAANNTYVLVNNGTFGGITMTLQKYSPAGALIWSINLLQYPIATSPSDMTVDPAGNTYVVSPYSYFNSFFDQYAMLSYNSAGTLRYFYNTYNSAAVFETWNLAYSCDFTKLVQAGAPAILEGQTALVNPANGNIGVPTNTLTHGEIYAGCVGPNGTYYCIASNPQFEPGNPATNELIDYNIAGPSPVLVWQTVVGYSFDDYEPKTPAGIPLNAIAAGCSFLYTYDGVSLEQHSLVTGALNITVAVPGGSNTSSSCVSGVAVDPACGFVYAGSTNNVYVYTSALAAVTNYAVNGTVYDVCYNAGRVSTCGSNAGNGFVAQFPAQTCILDTKTRVNATCAPTGKASVTPTFCVGPYTYVWSNGATTSSISNLSAGTYTVTMGANGSCVTEQDTVLIKATAVFTLSTVQTDVKCFGGNTGSATVTVVGGTAPYTYAWTPIGGTNATATGLSAGTYTVSVTDASPCTVTVSVTITQPPILTLAPTVTGVKCFGGSTGTITANAGGGTPAYTYAWTPVGGTNATATGLSIGTYTITLKDANGCTLTASAIVTQPPALTLSTTVVNPLCNGGLGSATANAGGGTPAYTYAWAPAGGTNALASNLTVGTYTVTVTDANSCTITASATITQPPALTAVINPIVNVKCNGGATGSLTVTAGGGTPAYTYAWAPAGGTNATATGLTAGSYTITVKDAHGCSITATATITQPPLLTVTTGTIVNVLCNGGNNGSATATAAGGTPAYTYAWTPVGGTNAIASNLTAGTYTITVTDANGCTATATAIITQPPVLTLALGPIVNVKCNGGATGSINSTAGGGTPAYTYAWTPVGGTGANATGLSAGTYTLTVKDANGCTITASATVTQPPLLTVSTTTVPATCGAPDGSATATPTGGTGAYTYNWTPSGGTNATASGLSAGTYTITVKDANGCTATATAVITSTGGGTVNITTIVNVSCFGGNNGSLTATPTGGTAPYTYNWTPSGGTNATATGLTAGSYTVTLTDANGCTSTATATVTQPPLLTVTTGAIVNVLCNGGNNGSATATANGGTGAYTYAWTPIGGTNATGTGLSTGTYTITVKDANGCTATATATITQPPLLTVTTGAIVNVLCNGGNNGAAKATAIGGTGAYTYNWTPAGGTNATASGLTAGTYTITVKDANGCTATATATITQPPVLNATTAVVSATCGQSNGSATVTPTSGTPGYTYSWAPVGGTNANATGLSAATYTVTVTDANGCTFTTTAVVPNAAAETVSITAVINVSCFGGNNGSINTNTIGGTAPYTYAWTPVGGTNANATSLSAGTYTITVHDANGCVSTASATVSQPPVLTVSTGAIVNVLCNGGNNGSATATANGGTGAYTYNWTPTGGTNATANGLTAGTYTITVTDANNCTTTATANITQPPLLTVTAGPVVNVLCNGGNNGSIGSTSGGGTPGYTYNWSNGATTATASGLTAGSYTITVTDANSCTATSSAVVTEPPALTQATSFVQSTCSNSNGSATVTIGGGTPAYIYNWSNGQTSSTATALSAGTYNVTVTDANNCTITASVNVTDAPAETVSIVSVTNVLCNGGNNGSINTNTVGGLAPYTYTWSNVQTNANATGLTAGSYTLTVQDANGCKATVSATVTEPPVLTAAAGPVTNVTCNGANNGSIGSNGGGGTPGYTYSWSNGQSNATATGLSGGTYTITITDANNCTATASAIVTEPPALTATMGAPTPVSCNGGNNGSATVTAGGGTAPYTYNWSNAQTSPTASGLIAGVYNVTVTDNHGCTATATVTITEPTAINLTTAFTTAFCNQADGSANVTALGGTPGYTYSWTNGNTTSAINNVFPGSYNITVTDANGCTSTASVTVPNAPGETVNITATVNASCNGGSDGSLNSNVIGGTAPYTYSWSNGQTNANATGLSAGSYTLTVTDATGCQSITIGNVGQPTPVTVTTAGAQTICISGSAVITATGTGGTPGYTYNWSNGATTSSVTVSPAVTTTYTVTMTDANGCGPVQATVTITVNPPLTLVMGPPQSICVGGNVTITATAGGGDGVYNYLWAPGGATTSSITVSPAATTTYTVTVTDNCGTPAVTDSVKVTVNPLPVISFKADTLSGCSPLCVAFTDLSTITSGTITGWAWNFGNGNSSNQQNPSTCYPNPGSYNVSLTVTSNNGCTASQTLNNMITVYSHPVAQFTESPQPTTIADPLINFTDMSTDSYGIAKWAWTFGDATDNTSNLKNPTHMYSDTGTYCANLTVTNIHGCMDSITNCLVIGPAFSLYIPNAFSPNADGVNDYFLAKGEFVYNFKMYIFDRWGMMLYYADDINKGWPGTVMGRGNDICQEDTYVYLITCNDNLGNKHSYIGKVTLIK